jgi:hypothetical protein
MFFSCRLGIVGLETEQVAGIYKLVQTHAKSRMKSYLIQSADVWKVYLLV